MCLSQADVDAAVAQANAAKAAADTAGDKATASQKAATAAREALTKARTAAAGSKKAVDKLELEEARTSTAAEASRRACAEATTKTTDAEADLASARSNQRKVHARFPGESNAQTRAADARVARARAALNAAMRRQASTCGDVAAHEKAADKAATAAGAARTQATADQRAVDNLAEAVTAAEETERTDAATARQKVTEAANAATYAAHVAEDFAAAQGADPGEPQSPQLGPAAGHSGQPTPPPKGAGVRTSSLFDFNLTGVAYSWKMSGEKWEQVPILLEKTEGYKHQIVVGGKYLFVGGLRTEEIGGLEIKLATLGDWRQIGSTRSDNCVIIKAEQVFGSTKETEYAGETKHIPSLRQESNPVQVSKKSPSYESISKDVVNDFKTKAKIAYAQAQMQASTAKYLIEDVSKCVVSYWEKQVGTYKQQIDEYKARITSFESTCSTYKVKAASFVKMISSASIKLSVGKVSGNVSGQVKALAGSLAEFKGDIKLGG